MKFDKLYEEKSDADKNCVTLRRYLTETEEKLDFITGSLNKEREAVQMMQAKFEEDIASKDKLVDLYKVQLETESKQRPKLQQTIDVSTNNSTPWPEFLTDLL
jgi:predicted  nucleic acid-binding Zn-ribbon protein